MNSNANSLRQVAKQLGVSYWQVRKWKYRECPELQQSPYDVAVIAEWCKTQGKEITANNANNTKLRPAVVKALVGGAVVVLAALIALLVPIISHYIGRSPNVVPTKALPVEYTSRSGISIVLSNKSKLPESISGIKIVLAQTTGPPQANMSFQLYRISGKIDYAGAVAGSAKTHYEQLSDDAVSFPVKGYLNVTADGWQLGLDVSVQEEIDGNGHVSVVLLLPDSMDVRSPHWLQDAGMGRVDYFSGDSKKVFHLKRFLSDAGVVGISVTARYGEDQTSTYTTEIEFSTSN